MKNKKVFVISAIIAAIAIVALVIYNSGITGLVASDPDSELTTPREVRQGAPVIEVPADEYQEMYNSDGFVEVICPDGRQGIEIIMAHPFKDPCFVSQ